MERKFDKRIDKDFVDVYTVFNRFSSDLIGTTVYASNSIEDFQDLDRCKKGIVDHINSPHGFAVTLGNGETFFFDFVIPAFAVKIETLRPFTIKEFQETFTIGYPINFRKKGDTRDNLLLFLGNTWVENKEAVEIGNEKYSLEELFNNYEYKKLHMNEFKPFGVEEWR